MFCLSTVSWISHHPPCASITPGHKSYFTSHSRAVHALQEGKTKQSFYILVKCMISIITSIQNHATSEIAPFDEWDLDTNFEVSKSRKKRSVTGTVLPMEMHPSWFLQCHAIFFSLQHYNQKETETSLYEIFRLVDNRRPHIYENSCKKCRCVERCRNFLLKE